MQAIHIFKAGKHTSAGGQTLDFTEDALRASAAAYDPAIHEAPIVVGHPKDNAPAYGWVSSLQFNEETGLHAKPAQIDADFAELVAAGRFKKVSASFYTPDAAANPVPGTYYLRHVGFLGAQPPALKGLKQVEFSDSDEGVVEFSGEWENATFMRRFRDWFIDKFSREEADEVIPSYLVESMEAAARNPKPAESPVASYTETGESTMTEAEIKALQDRATAAEVKVADLEAKIATDFAERQAAEKTARAAKIAGQVDALVAAGKVLPAQKAELVAFLEALPAETVINFGEGDKAATTAAPDFLLAFLDKLPKQVDFGEHSAPDGAPSDISLTQLADQAANFRESQRQKGIHITAAQAVEAVKTGKAA